jgi:hypothetical protein
MIFTPQTIIVLVGLICLAILSVATTKAYEQNIDEVETLSPWIALPLVMAIIYLYIDNFSYVTYIISIGAVFLLFL